MQPWGGWTLWPHCDPNPTITLTFIPPPTSKFNPNTDSQAGPHPSTWWPVPPRHICFGIQPLSEEKKDDESDSQMKSTQFLSDPLPWDKCWSFVTEAKTAAWLRRWPLPECTTCQRLSPRCVCFRRSLVRTSMEILSGMKLGFATPSTSIGVFVNKTKMGMSWIGYFYLNFIHKAAFQRRFLELIKYKRYHQVVGM